MSDLINSILDAAKPANGAKAPRDRDRDQVDPEAKARIERDIATARAAGFATGVPLYDVGTVVNGTGVANARQKRAEFESLPPAGPALVALQATIASEKREDRIVDVRDLRMDAEGGIGLASEGRALWTCERDTVSALASRVAAAHPEGVRPVGLGSYLASCPKALRARNFNAWTEAAPADEPAMLRTREGKGGDRGIYAVVSPGYTAVDADQIAAHVHDALRAEGLDREMRARVTYDGRRSIIDVTAHSNVPAESYAAGEIFRAGVRLSTDDTGGGSIKGAGYIEQNLCRNLIILHTGEAHAFRVIHKGDVRACGRALRKGVRGALASARVFADQWRTACHDSILDLIETPVPQDDRAIDVVLAETMARAFAGTIARDVLPIGSGNVAARVKSVVPRLIAAWQADRREGSAAVRDHGGATRAAIVNAATRYAHTQADRWDGDAIERAAGRVLAGVERIELPTVEEFLAWQTTPAELVTLATKGGAA